MSNFRNFIFPDGVERFEVGTEAFVGKNASVTFAAAFTATPVIIIAIEKTGASQSACLVTTSTTGFSASRSASSGAATLHWAAYGS